MSSHISEAYVQQFADNVYFLFQQMGTKLRGTTREQRCVAAKDSWQRIGPVTAVKKTVRHGVTPQIDTPHSRRMIDLADWEWADLIDKQDVYRVLIDPQSAYTQQGAASLGRALDLSIISGFDADVQAGNEGAAIVPFVSECAGDHNFSIAPLSIERIVEINKDLDNHDVPEENRHIVMPPAGFGQLLRQSDDPNVSSKDYNDVKALVAGEIEYFLGFTWHKTNLLPSPSPGLRYGYAWHIDAMGLSIAADIVTEVKERADRSYSTQVWVGGSFGAVRVQGEGVVRFSIDITK